MPEIAVRVLDGPRVTIMRRSLADASELMHKIGVYLARISRLAFNNQRFGGVVWAPKAASDARPSVLGAVQDLSSGATIHHSRFEPRPALIATGELQRSIDYEIVGPKTVSVFSAAPYAAIHQNGGRSVLPVTPTVKANLSELLAGRPDLRPALGFLLSPRRTSVSAEVPARPFLGVPEKARGKIYEMARRFLGQAYHGVEDV